MTQSKTGARSYINAPDRAALVVHLTAGLEKDVLHEINNNGSVDLYKYPGLTAARMASINGRWKQANVPFQLVTLPANEPWEKRYLFLECLRPKPAKAPA